jgi:class 3 adenylate cyclase
VPEHVTFLLTEVVDSIKRWEEDDASMAAATGRLDAIVRDLVQAHGGVLVKPRGEGDSHFLTFDTPVDAVRCAVALQRAVADEPALALRTASHVGHAEMRDGDWYGTTVNRCARLRAAAHGRQSLVSAEVAEAVGDALPDDVSLLSLGRHRFKDLDEPVEVFQICAAGLVEDHPPLASLAHSHGLLLPRSSFVGRAEECAHIVDLLVGGAVVTVTGAPGVGKTRTALEAAVQWWDRTGAPVRLGARLADDDLVLSDDASSGAPPIAGPALLTARAPLGLADEVVVRLSPLDELHAEALLHDRVADDTPLPSGLVAACDGLPLAVELLARRASAVDPAVLAERLDADPLAVLGGDRRADPPRHASVRAAFAAAFDALTPAQQTDLLGAAPGDPEWVARGWHEADAPLPLVARFLAERGSAA